MSDTLSPDTGPHRDDATGPTRTAPEASGLDAMLAIAVESGRNGARPGEPLATYPIELLSECRKLTSMSQKKLAARMESDQSRVWKIEKDPLRAKLSSVVRYLQALGFTIVLVRESDLARLRLAVEDASEPTGGML